MIAQCRVVYQMPLTTGILIRPAIAFAREVNPFRMTELITHEVQITSIDSGSGKQTNHLVQSDTSFYHAVLVTNLEMPVHVGINQAEDDGLVAYQCLVVTLTIRNSLFILATVGHFPEQT